MGIVGSEARASALAVLQHTEALAKAQAAQGLWRAWQAGALPCDPLARLDEPLGLPGRPLRPRLVAPKDLPQRPMHTPEGHAALIHAVAHIEFNAIQLALDAVWRFGGLPLDFYADWLRVAQEEATHFLLLHERLGELGHDYGDFDAHDGLWQMCEKTRHDALARMALVPRLLEARGLDATPPMQAKLRQRGDLRTVAILDIILRDEVGHVAIGNHWFRHLCRVQGLEPLAHFKALARAHGAPRLKPPFNDEARRRAGFEPAELQALHHGY